VSFSPFLIENFSNNCQFNCVVRLSLTLSFYITAGETLYDCNKIDYFSKEAYSPDPSDSTMAIPCKSPNKFIPLVMWRLSPDVTRDNIFVCVSWSKKVVVSCLPGPSSLYALDESDNVMAPYRASLKWKCRAGVSESEINGYSNLTIEISLLELARD
jgi:hypothetical protein